VTEPVVVEVTEATAQLVADKLLPWLERADAPVSSRATPQDVVLRPRPSGNVS
jgi:hypothetical protein